ncbi:hypothetical protein [Amycolatopsis sp. NPDC054798]
MVALSAGEARSLLVRPKREINAVAAGKGFLGEFSQNITALIGRLEKKLSIFGKSDNQVAADVKAVGGCDQEKGFVG